MIRGLVHMTTALRGRKRVTAALAMPPNSSRNFGEQDFVTSHKPWSLQPTDFVKKFKLSLASEPH